MDSASQPHASDDRSYPSPTSVGKVPFTPHGTKRECETAYWLWGSPSSEQAPLIIVHGGPGAPGRDWKPMAALHDKYGIPVLLYDQIGCGESTHLPETKGDTSFWSMKLFLDELTNLKTFLNIQAFHLLGHSCGAMIAIEYALTQPKGLRKLIITSTSACEALRVQGLFQRRSELPQDLQDTLNTSEAKGLPETAEYKNAKDEYMRRFFCRVNPTPKEIKETMTLMEQDDTIPYTLYGPNPLKPTGPWKDFNVVPQLHEITEVTAPGGVLLTNGKYDMASDDGMMPFFTQIRAKVKWVRFAESAHFPHLEEARDFLNVLGSFLVIA